MVRSFKETDTDTHRRYTTIGNYRSLPHSRRTPTKKMQMEARGLRTARFYGIIYIAEEKDDE